MRKSTRRRYAADGCVFPLAPRRMVARVWTLWTERAAQRSVDDAADVDSDEDVEDL